MKRGGRTATVETQMERDMDSTKWKLIEAAPKDGTRIIGRAIDDNGMVLEQHVTWWGKTSHVPLYGWNHGSVENLDLWTPTHWRVWEN